MGLSLGLACSYFSRYYRIDIFKFYMMELCDAPLVVSYSTNVATLAVGFSVAAEKKIITPLQARRNKTIRNIPALCMCIA